MTNKLPLFSLTLLVGLCLSANVFAQSPNYQEDLLAKWANTSAYMLEIAEAMPAEDYEYKPTEDVMSFREQLVHLANNAAWLSSDYLGEERPPKKDPKTKEAVINYLKTIFTQAERAIQNLDMESLDAEISFFAGPMSRQRILFLLNDHLTHHRGQLVIYLRLKGIQPPKYRGW
ncbi:MAG: DinB family protein [Bacteroidetes bacterium]|nr:DinB family protein [Bacteroidota bacterium]